MNYLLYLVPKNLLSFIVGFLVHLPLPGPLSGWSVEWFAKRYKIDMSEAEKDISAYKSIGDLFIRRLKPGLRPVAPAEVVHPADSEITVAQKISSGDFIQAKGKSYKVSTVLGGSKGEHLGFEQGYHLTYYLCPTDYHRVHSPVDGQIVRITYSPGRLWPVNPWSVEHISQLFAVNERVTVWIQTSKGLVAVVLVGATNVGKMTLSFDEEIITNAEHFRKPIEKSYDQPIAIQRGAELGVFNMGSTVLLFLPKSYGDLPDLGLPKRVKYGQTLIR